MRRTFAASLLEKMRHNPDIVLLTADLGYGMWDKVRAEFPDRFHNVGSAEQLLVGAGVGLALSGKIPILYSITPFLLYRPFEFIRNYIAHERIKVILVGSGRDKDYAHDGFTHWAEEDVDAMYLFSRSIVHYRPCDINQVCVALDTALASVLPSYISLRR